eukprot:2187569-Rhodomonas_salina.5
MSGLRMYPRLRLGVHLQIETNAETETNLTCSLEVSGLHHPPQPPFHPARFYTLPRHLTKDSDPRPRDTANPSSYNKLLAHMIPRNGPRP